MSAAAKTSILVLGAGGMLGHTMLRYLGQQDDFRVAGAVRGDAIAGLPTAVRTGIDAMDSLAVEGLMDELRPDVVLNCVGLIKQRPEGQDPETAIMVNAVLPHRLAGMCRSGGVRLIHFSTDCVFSGSAGGYDESSLPDCTDVYGRSKLLGEVEGAGALTLRTSIIGPELGRGLGLFAWFLAQKGSARGFTRAVFSGLPTVELARIVSDIIRRQPDLHGVYHVSAAPITKYDLLDLVRTVYGLDTALVPDDTIVIDRSLDSSRFRRVTGYRPPAWPDLIEAMRAFG